MNITKEEKNGEAIVKVEGAITINEVAELGKRLLECFKANTSLALDLKDVSDCDTSGIQLLVSTNKMVKISKKEFSVIHASECVRTAAGRIGIESINFE